MTDPRRPESRDGQLPDPLDQNPAEAATEEHGSEDAQLFAEAEEGEGDVEGLAAAAADVELEPQAGAARKLVARAEGADDRRIGGVADQPVIAGIGLHAPVAAEPVGETGDAADRIDAAVRIERGEAGGAGHGRGHAEIGASCNRCRAQRTRGPIEKM